MFMIEIEVPNGVQVDMKGNVITVKGPLGTNARKWNDALLHLEKSGTKVKITPIGKGNLQRSSEQTERAFAKEVSNDINGVQKHFEKQMKILFAHFPMTVEAKGDTVIIKNIIGERGPRTAKIAGTTKVEVKGQNIRVYGTSLDDVAQTAANMRKACKIRNKDGRIFQDGIYFALEA